MAYTRKAHFKMPKPTMKPRSRLSSTQATLMKEHKPHHSAKHMAVMREMMRAGYCFQQAHDIAMQKAGK